MPPSMAGALNGDTSRPFLKEIVQITQIMHYNTEGNTITQTHTQKEETRETVEGTTIRDTSRLNNNNKLYYDNNYEDSKDHKYHSHYDDQPMHDYYHDMRNYDSYYNRNDMIRPSLPHGMASGLGRSEPASKYVSNT